MNNHRERVWIDIDLDRLTENYHAACALTHALVTCVVKSNAYGHGAAPVALALQQAGCRSFAVACAREALELRAHGITGEILVMGALEDAWLPELLTQRITLTAASGDELRRIHAAAPENDPAQVHLKADTGFHRLGVDWQSGAQLAELIKSCSHVKLQGLYSHLGLISRERDTLQYNRLMALRDALEAEGVRIPEVHLCDSIGLVRYPAWHLSRVRVGALLFGSHPAGDAYREIVNHETLVFKTRIAQLHAVAKGEIVGYGDDMPLTRDSVIATLAVGYGDGYPRCLSNGKGQAAVRGHRAPVVGLVCMDQTMVDVTDIPDCREGDEVTLLGGAISYDEYASWCHTNRNEAITILSRRPVRRYWRNGQIATETDSLLREE